MFALLLCGGVAIGMGMRHATASAMVRLLDTDHFADQRAGLDWLRQQPFVQPDRIATAGNSFGGIQVVLGA